jgi:hypothetical protein
MGNHVAFFYINPQHCQIIVRRNDWEKSTEASSLANQCLFDICDSSTAAKKKLYLIAQH